MVRAALTGHLVFSTLHTNDAAGAVPRLIDMGVEPPRGHPARLWRAAGCPECRRTGFKGRQGIFELMVVDETFHDAIVHRAGAQEYARLARASGMRTMFEDGLLKAAQGLTTIEELLETARMGSP